MNGMFHGKGTLTYVSGDKYIGEFVQGAFHGKGKYTTKSCNYDGSWAQHSVNNLQKINNLFTDAWKGSFSIP